jgi:hypothetical protein
MIEKIRPGKAKTKKKVLD